MPAGPLGRTGKARAWTVEYLDAHGAVVAGEERPAEVFIWERQTRPFRVAFGAGAHASGIRFTAVTDCVLSQLELFPADPTRDRRARD